MTTSRSRARALGLVPASTGYGKIAGNGEVVDETYQPLAAGFLKGQDIAIASGPMLVLALGG